MNPAYTPLAGEADYRHACDSILALARREILIFDRDLARLRPDETARLDALARFLLTGAGAGIRVVLHDPEPLLRDAPRLMRLVARFSHAIEIRQSPDNLRHLADTHVLADECNGVRRFHVDQPRAALIQDDPNYIQPWCQRFEELWELSRPWSGATPTGL